MNNDIFDAASKVSDALGAFNDEQISRTIRMALVAIGKEGLVEPKSIQVMQLPKTGTDD